MNLTTSQIFQLGSIIIGFLTTILSFMPQLDASLVAKIGGACAAAWAAIGTVLTGQAATVREVAAMPGVERITTNTQANANLISVARDESVPKVDLPPNTK